MLSSVIAVVIVVVVAKVIVDGVFEVGVLMVVVVIDVVGVEVVVEVVVVVAVAASADSSHAGIQHLSAPAPTHRPRLSRLALLYVMVVVFVSAVVVVVVVDSIVGDAQLMVSVVLSSACCWIRCTQAVIAAGCPTWAAIFLHAFLSWASIVMSSSDRCGGRSMKNPPFAPRLNWTSTANLTSLSPFSRSRGPNHRKRRCLIARTRS